MTYPEPWRFDNCRSVSYVRNGLLLLEAIMKTAVDLPFSHEKGSTYAVGGYKANRAVGTGTLIFGPLNSFIIRTC